MLQRRFSILGAAAALAALFAACGDDSTSSGSGGSASSGVGGADVLAGTTAIVAIVNPVVNDAHAAGVPAELGTERGAIAVVAEPGGDQRTDSTGLALVEVPTGAIDLSVGDAPALSHDVIAAGDVYDAAVAYDGAAAAFFPNTPIRYAVSTESGAFFYDADDAFADIAARLTEDDVVVVLRPGTYRGSLDIRGKGVVLFGEGWSDRAVVIEGSVVANGEQVRLRGLTITGDLTSNGNNFRISFSVVRGRSDIKGNGGAFLRNVFCGSATVPSSSATLLDNVGIAPSLTLPAVCD